MSEHDKPANGKAMAIDGEILPTMEIDCSDWVTEAPLEQWTRAPAIAVEGEILPETDGQPEGKDQAKHV
jgi:hypothetical protein